jgi:hypothetical protein
MTADTESLRQHRRLLHSRLTHLELLRQAEDRKRAKYNELVTAFMTATDKGEKELGREREKEKERDGKEKEKEKERDSHATHVSSSTTATSTSSTAVPSSQLVKSNSNSSVATSRDREARESPTQTSSPKTEKREKRTLRSASPTASSSTGNTPSVGFLESASPCMCSAILCFYFLSFLKYFLISCRVLIYSD